MTFDTKPDPNIQKQQALAERQNIESIRNGVKSDTDLKNRIYGGNIIRRAALNRGMIPNGG
jgi:hypothetical protein